MTERFPTIARATLDPAGAFGRHPLQPHQLLDRVTRTEHTIVLCHLGVPRIDPNDWSPSVDGLVRRPMHLTLSDHGAYELCSRSRCADGRRQPDAGARNAIHHVSIKVL